jgi:class 3 adenylate cyclase
VNAARAFTRWGDTAPVRAKMLRAVESSFVTIMFTDVVGSTTLYDRFGDDEGDAGVRRHFAVLREVVAAHEGREVKSTGDGLMVTFSSAVAAVRCAVALQRATTGADDGLDVRIGIDAGEPLSEGGDLYGTPVIVASRLCDAAGPGEILATQVVRQIAGPRVAELMRPAGSFRVKGISESVATALVRWREDDGEDAPPPREDAPLRPITVVIADDQRLLRTGFRVILDAEPDITVVGEAGDGLAAVDVVARRRPDVVLMDIRMPELDGLAAAERILADPQNATRS